MQAKKQAKKQQQALSGTPSKFIVAFQLLKCINDMSTIIFFFEFLGRDLSKPSC